MGVKIKFPVLNNLDYVDIIRDKTHLKTYPGSEHEGIAWRDLQRLIGEDLGAGSYRYALKFKNKNEIFSGIIKGLNVSGKIIESKNSSTDIEIKKLQEQIKSLGSGAGVSVELLLSMQKTSYETQVNFLNNEIQKKENQILKLENNIDRLEEELDNCGSIVEDLKSKTGVNQYLEIAQTFLKARMGNLKPVTNLKDSDPSDIPQEILDSIGLVDWSQVDPETLKQIVFYLNTFIQKLPLKGK